MAINSVLSRYGKSMNKVLGLSAIAAYGFGKGINSSGAEDAIFELATGNPNIDQDVLGVNLSPTDFMTPYKFPLPSKIGMAMYGAPGARAGIPKLMATYFDGTLNGKMLSGAYAKVSEPFAPNTPPRADGSLVFGLYNSRYGG